MCATGACVPLSRNHGRYIDNCDLIKGMAGKVVNVKPKDKLHLWVTFPDGKKETVTITPIESAE